MQITCMPYEMVNFSEEKSLQEWLNFASGMLDGIEILGVDSDSRWPLITFLKEKVEKEKLKISMLDINYCLINDIYKICDETTSGAIEKIKNDLKLAKFLNVPLIRCGGANGWYDYSGTDFGIRYDIIMGKVISILKRLLPFAEENSVKILIENHPGDASIRKDFFDTIFKEIRSPFLGINLDLVNTLFYPHQSVEDFLEAPQIFERINCFHANNIGASERGFEKLAINNGNLNSVELLKRVKDMGYNGWISYEYSGGLKEDIPKSIEIIKKIWGET